ncbi:hypothetical protein Ancab_000145 [Ancistrocladus abbreviatus]
MVEIRIFKAEEGRKDGATETSSNGGPEAMRKVVCVTGASGFIGSWLVQRILLRGYTVNATVIDLNFTKSANKFLCKSKNASDPKHTGHLLAMDKAKERLHLFQANLLEDGSFDSDVGSQGVFHLASPVVANPKDPQAEILEPAVKGMLNVLGSCAKFHSVKRVVLTSSMTTTKPEISYSDPEILEKSEGWYQLSKTLAEEVAWKFVKEKDIDVVVTNPSVIIGPLLQPTLNVTNAMILNLINEIVELLRKLYPTLQLPEKCMEDKPFMPTYQISKEKAKGLGLVGHTPLEVTLKETVESLKEKKFISF